CLCTIIVLLFFLLVRPPPSSTLFPYTTLFRSHHGGRGAAALAAPRERPAPSGKIHPPRRGNGTDRSDRPVDAARGLHARQSLEGSRTAADADRGQPVGAPVPRGAARTAARGNPKIHRDRSRHPRTRDHRKHGDAGSGPGGEAHAQSAC